MAALALAHDDLAIAVKDEDSDADLWAGIHVGGVSEDWWDEEHTSKYQGRIATSDVPFPASNSL